jgi:hypothetical protein
MGETPETRRLLAWYHRLMNDREISDELTGLMPMVWHGVVAGVRCRGSIIAAVEGSHVELRCAECGAVMGVIHIDILCGLIGLDE